MYEQFVDSCKSTKYLPISLVVEVVANMSQPGNFGPWSPFRLAPAPAGLRMVPPEVIRLGKLSGLRLLETLLLAAFNTNSVAHILSVIRCTFVISMILIDQCYMWTRYGKNTKI
jgi:hypothetical protein